MPAVSAINQLQRSRESGSHGSPVNRGKVLGCSTPEAEHKRCQARSLPSSPSRCFPCFPSIAALESNKYQALECNVHPRPACLLLTLLDPGTMTCPQCTQGYILPGEPRGTFVDGAYFSPAPEGGSSTKAIVFLTDIFGLGLRNCKILADAYAKKVECDVWVPDLFAGASRCRACLLASSDLLSTTRCCRPPGCHCRGARASHGGSSWPEGVLDSQN